MKTKVTPRLLDIVMRLGKLARKQMLHLKIMCFYWRQLNILEEYETGCGGQI